MVVNCSAVEYDLTGRSIISCAAIKEIKFKGRGYMTEPTWYCWFHHIIMSRRKVSGNIG